MASVLKFVGQIAPSGTTLTVDFIGVTPYRVTRWPLAVATRREAMLGGRGSFAEVDDEMDITVSGASLLASLESIGRLLDQAARWARGEPVYPVYLHYQPTAASDELRAVVLGGSIELPENFTLSPVVTVIDPVQLRFRRSGLWYGDATAQTDTTATNPEVAVVSGFTALNAPAPIAVGVEGIELDKAAVNGSWLLLSSADTAARAGQRILLLAAESFADGSAFTSVGDSAKFARDNSVLRFTPSAAEQAFRALVPSLATTDSTVRRWGMWINYRNNSATTAFRVWGIFYSSYNASGTVETYTPMLLIPAGVSKPGWTFVGSAALPDSLVRVSLEIEASAASGSLDIDDIVIMALDYPDGDFALTVDGAGGGISLQTNMVVDAAPLARQSPAVYVIENNTYQWLNYRGDGYLTMREGCTAVAVAWLTEGYSSDTYWRALDTGNAPQNPTVRVTRTDAFLTPR